MTKANWQKRISALPPGLTQTEVARRLGEKHGTARLWCLKLNYGFVDGRTLPWNDSRCKRAGATDWDKVDWRKSNIEISRETGRTRERVRQVREKRGETKVNGRK